jgi:hypothetical protein
MNVILSRKGFDSESGGFPSPVLPDGRLLSQPIPDPGSDTGYGDIADASGNSYYQIMKSLDTGFRSGGAVRRFTSHSGCHLDPDLIASVRERKPGWTGALGQAGAAGRHLDNQGVGRGDLFLFFGWFRFAVFDGTRTGRTADIRPRFCDRSRGGINGLYRRDMHVIFGYLQVRDVLGIGEGSFVPEWLSDHPHCAHSFRGKKSNRIYAAAERASWNPSVQGYGVFRFHDALVLTKKGARRSCWNLPGFFREAAVSYHDEKCWKDGFFQSARRGQEFVVSGSEPVRAWAKDLVDRFGAEAVDSADGLAAG